MINMVDVSLAESVSPRDSAAALRKEGGRWLRRHREAAGKTESDIAKAVGFACPSIIGGIERGAYRPPATAYAAYAEVLAMDRAVFARAMLEYYDTDTYNCLFESTNWHSRWGLSKASQSRATDNGEPDLPNLHIREPKRDGACTWTLSEQTALETANCRWPFDASALGDGAYELTVYDAADYAAACYVDRRTGYVVLIVHKDTNGVHFVDAAGRLMDKEDQEWMGRMFGLEKGAGDDSQTTTSKTLGSEDWRPLSITADRI